MLKRHHLLWISCFICGFLQTKLVASELSPSRFYFKLDAGYNSEHEVASSKLSLIYRPIRLSGLETSLAVDYLEPVSVSEDMTVEKQSLSNLRLGLAYRWQGQHWTFTPEVGGAVNLSDQKENQVEVGDTQGFASLTFGYKFDDKLEVYSVVNHDAGSDILNSSNTVSLGLRFTFGDSQVKRQRKIQNEIRLQNQAASTNAVKSEIAMNAVIDPKAQQRLLATKLAVTPVPAQSQALLSAIQPQPNPEQEFESLAAKEVQPESNIRSHLNTFFSVQIGSFNDPASIEPFVFKWGLNQAELVTRLVGKSTKLSFGRYETKEQAELVMEQLKEIGLDGFVVNIRR